MFIHQNKIKLSVLRYIVFIKWIAKSMSRNQLIKLQRQNPFYDYLIFPLKIKFH